jgi:metal-responsive CopG/Arc/MetJ family transcriptional regulator
VSETVAAALRQYLSRGTWREAIAMELGLAALDAAERAVEERRAEE